MSANTAAINLAADEVAVIQMALDALDQRIAERDMDLGKDHDWQEGVQLLRQKLTVAAEQLPDVEAASEDYLAQCLSTGDGELAILLGVEPNTEGRTVEELKCLWVNKVEAAGLNAKVAKQFLDNRLEAEGVA